MKINVVPYDTFKEIENNILALKADRAFCQKIFLVYIKV